MTPGSIQMAMTKAEKKKAAARARRNRANKGINVVNLAEGYVQTGIWTQTLFNANPYEFVTGMFDGTFTPGSDGGSRISIPELLGAGKGGVGGNFGSYASNLPNALARNISGDWNTSQNPKLTEIASGLVMPAVQTALVGVGFKFGKRATAGVRRKINKGLKDFKLDGFIRF